ncbi:hypothetical protein B0O95_10212 [Mycetohabitans endofungorum]|uniref:Uncharacterized protein n=1 Tax=Mycetohabitans endofungorum TaxID=417203 RepID=A0A2P5KD54_9BURK|nr:hypothetical protein B0O95_10212 [Mycetohabitans endofungorum]
MNEHEHGKDDEMQADERFRQTLVVASEPSKAIEPSETALDEPSVRQQDKALLCLWPFDNLQFDAFILRGLCRLFSYITLVGKGKLRALPAHKLPRLCQLRNLHALLLVGRRDMNRQPMPERIDGHMHLACPFALIAVVACAWATLVARLQRTPVQNHRTGLSLPTLATRSTERKS